MKVFGTNLLCELTFKLIDLNGSLFDNSRNDILGELLIILKNEWSHHFSLSYQLGLRFKDRLLNTARDLLVTCTCFRNNKVQENDTGN